MQYQQFLKRSQRVDFGCQPLNFQEHFLCDDPRPHSHWPAHNLNVNFTFLTNGNDTVRD